MHYRRKLVLCAVMMTVLFAGLASGETQRLPVDRIVVVRGQDATGLAGETVTIQVDVFGPLRRGILGGEGERRQVPNVPVTFTILHTDCTDIELITPPVVNTDAGGRATAEVRLGKKFGDHYIEARATGFDGKRRKALIRLTSGVQLFGNDQEGTAGTSLPERLGLQIFDAESNPIPNIPVYFKIEGAVSGASLDPPHTQTDAEGIAATSLKLPPRTQRILINAEVADPQNQYTARGVRLEAMSVNRTMMLISLIGGLAIFIFGMKQMSDGLQRVAGDKLRWILRMFTRNRFIGITVGALVTALIQSSSACSVMTVGFVNAGLVTLRQAIGVILGANIGTTVTGQIISLRISELAFPAIAIGLLVMMVVRNRTHRFWGQAIMGFGLLFLGMTIMGDTLKPLQQVPSFREAFLVFDATPVDGVMPIKAVLLSLAVGTLMTVLIQSSSATIGLTIALAGTGLINFYTAVPIILGDNIGTTITAILASIGANRAARRTAAAHAMFNALGALYMIAFFYVPAPWSETRRPIFLEFVNAVTSGNVFAEVPVNIERHVAMAHTFFNVFNVLVFIPLVVPLERLCNLIVPIRKEEEERITYLEPHLLNQPSIALEQAVREIGYMAQQALQSLNQSFTTILEFDTKTEEAMLKREDTIDRLQAEISDYLVKLSQHDLSENQSKILAPLLHAVNDVERIGDHAENIMELGAVKASKKMVFSELATKELERMLGVVREQFRHVLAAIEHHNIASADKALKLEEQVNNLDEELHENHVCRLEHGECDAQVGVIFLDIVTNFEKVGDHLTNVAERMKLVIETMNEEA